MTSAPRAIASFFEQTKLVIKGQDHKLRWLLAAFLSGRHVLLEDKPGTGKTTLAKSLSACTGSEFQRVQFTPDLLPSDILGVSVYEPSTQVFRFHEGPIFTQVLLADEVNRSSPRTQSALLEAMAEKQVTVEGHAKKLDDLFFVIATQNPLSFQGTYPLPEAQLDRFSLSFDLGYLALEDELDMALAGGASLEPVQPAFFKEDALRFRAEIQGIELHRDLARYAVELIQKTREHASFRLGVSPRCSMDMVALSKALAWVDGQRFVHPEHVQELLVPVLAHRCLLDPATAHGGNHSDEVLREMISHTPLPR